MKNNKVLRGVGKVLLYLFGLLSIGANVVSISNTVSRLKDLDKVSESEETENG